jgi:hypothetical protein
MPDVSLLVLTADELGPTFSSVRGEYNGDTDYFASYINNDSAALTEAAAVRIQVGFVDTPATPAPLLIEPNDLDAKALVSGMFQALFGWDEVLDVASVDLGTLGLPYAAHRVDVREGTGDNELLTTEYLVKMSRGRVQATLIVSASNEPLLGGVSLAQLTTNARMFAERLAEKLIRLLPAE